MTDRSMRDLILRVADQFRLDPYGIHGIPHWARVLANGKRLARASGADEWVVCLFSVFHDARRLNDWDDPAHGLRGAELAVDKRGEWFQASDWQIEVLHDACSNHTHQKHHDDVTVQTCWDADRLDLGRVGTVPSKRYLNTEYGRSPEMFWWAHERRYPQLF